MKTAILILLSFLMFSCSVTEPEEVEETINLKYIYQISKEAGAITTPKTLNGVETMLIGGVTYECIEYDWIKATVKGDDLIWYECYRAGKYYTYDYNPVYIYKWEKK